MEGTTHKYATGDSSCSVVISELSTASSINCILLEAVSVVLWQVLLIGSITKLFLKAWAMKVEGLPLRTWTVM